MNFVAALLHKYPYGGCCRLSQHLAPAACLLAGLGLAAVVERVRQSPRYGRYALRSAVGCLALVAAIGMVRDLWRPFKDHDALWARNVVRELFALDPASEPLEPSQAEVSDLDERRSQRDRNR